MSVSAPLAAIRAQHPLLHCISNIVSANDCANLALAIGVKSSMEGPFLSWDQCSNAARMDLRAPLFWRVNTRMPARMEPPTVETRKGTT